MVNHVEPGSAVVVRFSLGGYRGMGIFADGYPASAASNCSGTPTTDLQRLNWPSGVRLSYSPGNDTYGFEWATDRSWTAAECSCSSSPTGARRWRSSRSTGGSHDNGGDHQGGSGSDAHGGGHDGDSYDGGGRHH